MQGYNHPSRPRKLGPKHRKILVQQGLPEQYVSAYSVIGKFLLVDKPEHLNGDCPFCGSAYKDDGCPSLVMSPIVCHGCERTLWVYCDLKDALVNGDEYRAEARRLGITDPKRAWDERGIPMEALS